MMQSRLGRHGQYLLLGIILLAALGVRLYGQDWDQGTYQHPDERYIAMVSANRLSMPAFSDLGDILKPASSPINPRRDDENGNPISFAYGTLPIYVQSTVSASLNLFSERDWGSYAELYRVGRTLTAVLDTITVALVFLIGRRLFGVAAGAIGATLYAFSVLAIQLGHFFAVDTWLTLFVTATLYFLIRYIDKPTLGRSLAIGVAVGLTFATKASVPALLVVLLFGYGYVYWQSDRRLDVLIAATSGAVVSLVVFTIFEPYALIRSGPFIEDIRIQSRIVRGITDVPFTRQFVGLTPGIYELRNLFAFTIGPGFLLAALAGIVFAIRRVIVARDVALAIPVLWVLAYVPILLTTEARFLRYSLPLLPTVAVLAAGLLTWMIAQPRTRLAGQVVTVFVLASTTLWAVGFMTIYTQEHSRVAASKWIHQNVPAGSVLTAESWDDPLPNRYPGSPPLNYEIRTLDIYGDNPPDEKVDYLFDALQDVDYVVLSSNRLIDSVDNLPWRYAVQNEYYRRLDQGQLGFQLAYEGLVQPELFGLSYADQDADESFTVYDHPHVRIFQRVDDLTRDEFRQRFLWSINQPWVPQRNPSEKWLMLDGPVSEINTADDDEWNVPARGNDVVAILSWLAAIELIGLSALPLAAHVLRRSPDRGAFSARLIGIIIIGWIVWIGASLKLWPATVWTVIAATAVMAIAAWGTRLPLVPERATARLPGLRTWIAGAGIYLALFVLFLLFRALYPDFWQTYFGGEKPFELAYLRAVSQSTEFPPFDPWYSGGIINYYYYGWHLVSTVIKLSGVGISTGFQLATASIAALLGLQCFAVASMLARRAQKWEKGTLPVAGLLTTFLVLFAGNLDGIIQVIEKRLDVADQFDFWRSTRVIDHTINEFPYFSQLWADLHPHVINMPIYVLLLTLVGHIALDAHTSRQRNDVTLSHPVSLLALVALVLGTVAVTNSWDAPLAVGLTAGAFLYAGVLRGAWHWLTGLGYGLLVIAAAFALFAPFYLGFYSIVDGVAVTSESSAARQFLTHWGLLFFVVLAALFGLLLRQKPWRRSRDAAYLVTATALAGGGSSAIVQSVRGIPPDVVSFVGTLLVATAVMTIAALVVRPDRFRGALLGVVLLLSGVAAALSPVRPSATLALAITALATMFALRHWRYPLRFMPWALVAVAGITIAAVEILYVVDDLRNSPWERMNTVFKFYLQAWLLLAIGGPTVFSRMLYGRMTARQRVPGANLLVTGATIVVVGAGIIYPLFGTPVRLDQDMESSPTGLTLDGYAWMERGSIFNGTGETITFGDDLAAIHWLNDNAEGTPVILEASIGPYRGNGSRISSATGLPTVLGWDRHQRQQRYHPGINQRMHAVRAIYNETDMTTKLEGLRAYDVRYVIVGDVERYWNTPENSEVYASAEGLAAFDALVGNGLERVFVSGQTIIYAVADFPRLSAVTLP